MAKNTAYNPLQSNVDSLFPQGSRGPLPPSGGYDPMQMAGSPAPHLAGSMPQPAAPIQPEGVDPVGVAIRHLLAAKLGRKV